MAIIKMTSVFQSAGVLLLRACTQLLSIFPPALINGPLCLCLRSQGEDGESGVIKGWGHSLWRGLTVEFDVEGHLDWTSGGVFLKKIVTAAPTHPPTHPLS